MDNFIRLFRELKPYDKRICAWTAFAGIFNAFCVLAPLVNHYQPDYHCSYKSIWEGGFENNHVSNLRTKLLVSIIYFIKQFSRDRVLLRTVHGMKSLKTLSHQQQKKENFQSVFCMKEHGNNF